MTFLFWLVVAVILALVAVCVWATVQDRRVERERAERLRASAYGTSRPAFRNLNWSSTPRASQEHRKVESHASNYGTVDPVYYGAGTSYDFSSSWDSSPSSDCGSSDSGGSSDGGGSCDGGDGGGSD
jgi:uncharacterized membrane protein YgcG